jgi:3-hydroxybutyryl-CoA dehydrogenase
MGAGIAQSAAATGFVVHTFDTSPDLVEKAYATISQKLDERVAAGKLPKHDKEATMSRLHVGKSLSVLADAECVIEAVVEDLSAKKKVFADVEKVVSERTLLASNTSSLSIDKMSESLRRPERFIGMHFFNPAPVMKLVELVQGTKSAAQAMVDGRAVCAKLDKTAVKVKDSPGFIGNRVNRHFYLEALRLLETGEADMRSIDAAIRNVGGFKMGPFELLDLIGLDVNLSVTRSVWEGFNKPARFAPNAIQEKLVESGHLGRKSKRGFYDYTNGDPSPAYEGKLKDSSGWKASPSLSAFAAALGKPADRAMWLFARILLAVVNEGGRTADTIALPRDVDVTMELGFNYPQGPLGVADHVGLDVVQRLMTEFFGETKGDERYAANALLDRLVAEGELGEQSAKGFHYHAL